MQSLEVIDTQFLGKQIIEYPSSLRAGDSKAAPIGCNLISCLIGIYSHFSLYFSGEVHAVSVKTYYPRSPETQIGLTFLSAALLQEHQQCLLSANTFSFPSSSFLYIRSNSDYGYQRRTTVPRARKKVSIACQK